MKPTIVQVVQHLTPGGIETMALDLMHQLKDRADVHIVSLESTFDVASEKWPRLKPHVAHLHFLDKQPGHSLTTLFKLRTLLLNLKATAVHSHHIGPLLYGGLAAKLAGIKYHVHTEHDAWHLNVERSARLQRWLLRSLRPTVVADCEVVAHELTYHCPDTTPEVILNGVDTERFVPASDQRKATLRERLGLPSGHLLIGCAARLEHVKGHQYLLEALSMTSDTTLLLAGDGSLRTALQNQAKRLEISDRVRFLGNLDHMVPFYQLLDLFCLPSLNEGLPLSPLEAQACDVPVIVTNVGGCANVICPNSGCLLPAGDVEAIRQAILCFQYTNPNQHPRNFVLKVGDLKRTASAYLSLLHPEQEEVCHG